MILKFVMETGNSYVVIATTYFIFSLLMWSRVVCKVLRERRARLVAKLDPQRDCHAIVVHTLYVEFPFLTRKAGEASLLRSFAVPSIRRILQRAGEFKTRPSKRYDDTEILTAELMHHHVDSQRGSTAIRRINYIHSRYPDITNDDMLGALAILVFTPMDWCENYGYRPWTPAEKTAFFTVWRNVATRMGIRHVPSNLDALRALLQKYEATNLAYAPENAIVAGPTLSLWLSPYLSVLRPLVLQFALGLLDHPLLKAMGWPVPPAWFCALARFMLKLHGFFVRHFLPPRSLSSVLNRISSPAIDGLGSATSCPMTCMSTTWAEVSTPLDAHAELLPLKFHLFEPVTYPHGYRISEVGASKKGKLGTTYPGELACPIFMCSN